MTANANYAWMPVTGKNSLLERQLDFPSVYQLAGSRRRLPCYLGYDKFEDLAVLQLGVNPEDPAEFFVLFKNKDFPQGRRFMSIQELTRKIKTRDLFKFFREKMKVSPIAIKNASKEQIPMEDRYVLTEFLDDRVKAIQLGDATTCDSRIMR